MKRVFAGFASVVALAVLSPWLAAALQEPATAPAAAPSSVRESRAELQQLTDAAKHEAAAQLIAGVLARPDWSAAEERERAEFHFAAGVAFGAAQSYDEAALAAHAARGLSGSSELGLASAYNAGTFRLLRAEQLRLEIPEVRQALKLPPIAPATPGANPQAGSAAGPPGLDQAADPLGVARAAYLAARADLVERWRADPADVDTRANLELAVRRLRELDELEREREEQKQEPNERQDPDQKQDPQKQDSQDDKSEEPKDGEQQEQPEDPQQDSEPKAPEDKPEDPGEDKQQEQPEPKADEEQDASKPEENEPKDGAEPAKPEDERLLTPEEIQRLLQQLDKIEDQAAQVQAALRRARRVPVKKDW